MCGHLCFAKAVEKPRTPVSLRRREQLLVGGLVLQDRLSTSPLCRLHLQTHSEFRRHTHRSFEVLSDRSFAGGVRRS